MFDPASAIRHITLVLSQAGSLHEQPAGQAPPRRCDCCCDTGAAPMGSTPFECRDEAEGFLIVTSAADKGLVDIYGCWPLVLFPESALGWMRKDIGGKEVEEIATHGSNSADNLTWHTVTRAVGNRNSFT